VDLYGGQITDFYDVMNNKNKKEMGVGIICGSFDIIHPGYVRMFKDAAKICDKIIVALQGDPTIDRPNKCKPVQTLEDRIEILESIKYIDEILVYNTEAELYELLCDVKYDTRILGTDYIGIDYTGADLEKPVYFHERSHTYSTTSIKEKIFYEQLYKFKKENDSCMKD
jgi:glycerol-3-phosphate cytidylyltransferase